MVEPLELRRELHKRYYHRGKFRIGETEDAADCFETLLTGLHYDLATSLDTECDCRIHKTFGLDYSHIMSCPCGQHVEIMRSDPDMFMHTFYVSEVAKKVKIKGYDRMGNLL